MIACSGKGDTPVEKPIDKPVDKPAPKKILILGGTGFLGPHVVNAALARGHTVTMFNRGKTHPKLFPDVEKLLGDRDGKLDALNGRTWDAVVDTSGYVPRIVKQSAELLGPNVGQYIFISTISVYAEGMKPNGDETSPLEKLGEPGSEDPKYYGANKALSEQAVEAAIPGKVTIVRPGLIVGPLDPTGRFTHWATRMADGGEVLCPGDGTTPTQIIDGRDLAAWLVTLIERRTIGTFNALGPGPKLPALTMKKMLDDCNKAAGNKATLVWVAADFLDKQEVSGWSEMPAWIDLKDMAGFGTIDNARAVDAGLTFRTPYESAKDTLAWLDSPDFAIWLDEIPEDKRAAAKLRVRTSGIARDKEAKVIEAWKARG